jgi:hypothetical protein
MEELSMQMAERKTIDDGSVISGLLTKKEVRQKEKKKQKKKNVLEYGKLSEFPTFQHDKQTISNSYYLYNYNLYRSFQD